MIAHYLKSLGGMDVLGIVSLLAALVLFLVVLWRTFRMTKAHIKTMERLPLDNPPDSPAHREEVTP